MEDNPKTINRQQLYNEIWEIAVTGVSKKYNVPYSRLMKICKENSIPTPPAGYWTSISFGRQVEKIPMPESEIIEVVLVDDAKKQKNKPKEVSKKKATGERTHEKVVIEDLEKGTDNLVVHQPVTGFHNVYKREVLYQEVWDKPVVEVAVKYGVSDVTIHKVCKALNIPVPPRGYWAKLRSGEKQQKIPLPPTKGATEKIGPRSFEEVKVSPERAETLGFLDDEERKKILDAATQLELTTENERLHKKIVAYRSVVNDWNKKDTKTEGAQRGFKNYSNRPPFLAGVISIESLPRVYRILDALYREVESLGGSINDDLSLLIRNEHVMLEIAEGQDEIKHEITRQEAQEMIKYEDAKRHHSWATEPKIRKYDYTFNGRFRISIRQSRYFRDTDNMKIESKLGEMLIELYEESEVVRIDREKREEAARKREEEAKRQEDRRNRYNDEVERTIELQNEALDFQISTRIRSYIEAVKNNSSQVGLDNETSTWIEWATKKADWFDPTVSREDEFLGKRQHGKKEEEKALRRAGYYW